MTGNEQKLVAKLLNLASDEFGGHICNDVPNKFYKGWTIEERKQFVKEYHEWNGDPEEYDEDHLHLPDFAIMAFLADKIKHPLTWKNI